MLHSTYLPGENLCLDYILGLELSNCQFLSKQSSILFGDFDQPFLLPNLDDSLEFSFTNAYFSLCVNGRGTEGCCCTCLVVGLCLKLSKQSRLYDDGLHCTFVRHLED